MSSSSQLGVNSDVDYCRLSIFKGDVHQLTLRTGLSKFSICILGLRTLSSWRTTVSKFCFTTYEIYLKDKETQGNKN